MGRKKRDLPARMVNVRLIGADLVRMDSLCKQERRNQSDMLRWLINEEYERRERARERSATPSLAVQIGDEVR